MAGDDDDQQLSEYELQRQQRIASNRAKMAELQVCLGTIWERVVWLWKHLGHPTM